MDSGTITIIVIALFVIAIVAAYLVYRQKIRARIKAPGFEFEIDASDEKPPPQHAIEIEEAESTAGGILAEDETGGGVGIKKAKVQDDIIATSKPPEQDSPKA